MSHIKEMTLERYQQAIDLGLFDGQRIELIEGEIIECPPRSCRHDVATALTQRELKRVFGNRFWVRVHMSIVGIHNSEPEADLAVVVGEPKDFHEKPTNAELVVEVSESSLLFDRTRKARLYAGMDIAEYWILNLVNDRLEVFRQPKVDRIDLKESRYEEKIVYGRGETVSPLTRPRAKIKIADLLP